MGMTWQECADHKADALAWWQRCNDPSCRHGVGTSTQRVTCGNLTCPYCIHTNASEIVKAIRIVNPTYYAVLQLVTEDWAERHRLITQMFRRFDRNGYAMRALHTSEENPQGTGCHMNLWWHGSRVDAKTLSGYATKLAPGGVKYASPWRGRNPEYGIKDAVRGTGINSDQVDLTAKQQRFLDLNGGRLFHARTSFWRNAAGEPTLNLEATVASARRTSPR